MPVAGRKPLAQPPIVPSLPVIQPPEYKGIVQDDKSQPLQSLIAYVSGSSWTVDYYAQVVGEHNDLREIDPGQAGTFQQYQKTFSLEIKVADPLVSSYDNERGITTVHGGANIYPFMIPNKSDYFVADAADNQKALFRITTVERKTHNRDSVFFVEYEIVAYIENDSNELYQNLESKVIRTYHFSKDRLLEGLQPTIKTEEYQKVMNLKVLYSDMVKYYTKNFFNVVYGTLVIPGQSSAYYDPFLVKYFKRLTDTNDSPEIREIKQIPTDREVFLNQPQFWDLLVNKDYDGKVYCNNTMGLVNKALFVKNSYVQGLAFSNIRYVVYPITTDSSLLVGNCEQAKLESMESLVDTTGQNNVLYSVQDNTFEYATKTYKLIQEVLVDDKYVLSNDFYTGTEDQSVLEILVKDYLKGNTLDLNLLYAVTDKFRKWKRLEQFYYGPILLTLIKEADRAQYT